ncbi:MAG: DUF3471 domain-containing protein, partial [Gemmatimonadales bacterium]|nr:DUF3471 domain-containing protein [Gemmatimonadales bacterium]
ARELWREVTPTPIGSLIPELPHLLAELSGYALGLNASDYRGHKLLQHTGGLPGYLSKVAMIPSRRLGVVVLTNQESGAAFNSIAYHVLDHYLGVEPPDYVSVFAKLAEQNRADWRKLEREAAGSRDSTSRPSLPLAAYAGTYRDDWYGEVTIAREGGRLVIRFARTPLLVGALHHWQHDTFLARWRARELRADAYVTFALEADGGIAQVRMVPISPAVDFSFDFQDLFLRPVGDK